MYSGVTLFGSAYAAHWFALFLSGHLIIECKYHYLTKYLPKKISFLPDQLGCELTQIA
jgi:hypothetical protein